jgi:hypothetical protein
MNATTTRKKAEDSAPAVPQSVPPQSSAVSGDYNGFIWQQLSELQKSVAELSSNIQHLKSSVDSTKTKVDDLVNWKHKIIGGAIVFGAICTVLGFAISKASDYITIKAPTAIQAPAK